MRAKFTSLYSTLADADLLIDGLLATHYSEENHYPFHIWFGLCGDEDMYSVPQRLYGEFEHLYRNYPEGN